MENILSYNDWGFLACFPHLYAAVDHLLGRLKIQFVGPEIKRVY